MGKTKTKEKAEEYNQLRRQYSGGKIDQEEFEEKLGREINIQHLDSADEGDENFRNSLANGTVLRGFLKVV